MVKGCIQCWLATDHSSSFSNGCLEELRADGAIEVRFTDDRDCRHAQTTADDDALLSVTSQAVPSHSDRLRLWHNTAQLSNNNRLEPSSPGSAIHQLDTPIVSVWNKLFGCCCGRTPDNEENCPICYRRFSRVVTQTDIQEHIARCISRQQTRKSPVVGDRYSVFTFTGARRGEKGTEADVECSICFEDFKRDDRIAILNCFCQYHEECILSWFERDRGCPFHAPLP